MARHLRTWKVKSIFIYSGFFIRNLKPRVVIFTMEYLCLLGALGNVCRHRLVVTTEVGGVTRASRGQRPERLLNTLLPRPKTGYHAAHRVRWGRNPLCSEVRLSRSFPCHHGGKTLMPTMCLLFRTLFEPSLNPATHFFPFFRVFFFFFY